MTRCGRAFARRELPRANGRVAHGVFTPELRFDSCLPEYGIYLSSLGKKD